MNEFENKRIAFIFLKTLNLSGITIMTKAIHIKFTGFVPVFMFGTFQQAIILSAWRTKVEFIYHSYIVENT